MKREHNITTETPLPSGYTRLNYIEATGTQYIDTDYYVGNKKTRIIAGFEKKSPLYQAGVLFACCSPQDNQAFLNPYYGVGTSNDQRLAIYASGRGLLALIPSKQNVLVHFDCTIDIPNQTSSIYIEQGSDILKIDTYTSTIYINTLAIFAQHLGTSYNAKVSAILRYFFIYENDVLVRNYITALRDYDSKPGLYDVVANEFKTNAGTGEFQYA